MIGLFDFTNITLIDSPRTLSVTKVTNPFSSRIPRSEGYVLSIMVLIDAPDQKFTALFGNSSLIRNGTIWERQYWGGPWTWTDASTKLETYLGAPLIAPFAAVSSLNPQLSNSSYMSLMAFAGDKSVSTIKLGIFTADYVATRKTSILPPSFSLTSI